MVRSVSEKLSLEELRHILTTMNSWNADEVDCPICASARQKLAAIAAVRMGHQFIGFEKEKTYFEKAQIRIKAAQSQGKLAGTWF